MGRKKIQIQRITDERNRQVRRSWSHVEWGEEGRELASASTPSRQSKRASWRRGPLEAIMEGEGLSWEERSPHLPQLLEPCVSEL